MPSVIAQAVLLPVTVFDATAGRLDTCCYLPIRPCPEEDEVKITKDRFGGPNYGSGPFLYIKEYPAYLDTGQEMYPNPFAGIRFAAGEGWSIDYSSLEGSIDSGYFFCYQTHARVAFRPNPREQRGYWIYGQQWKYEVKRIGSDWYFYSYYRRSPDWQPYIVPTEQYQTAPIPGYSDAVAACCDRSFSVEVNGERLTQNGRVVSQRVKEFVAVYDPDDDLVVRRFVQDFDTINYLDVYTSGNASSFQAAYVDACNELLNTEINSLANILEAADAIKGLCELLRDPAKGIVDLLKSFKDPRDAWLMYRYSYSTTKADVSEYIELYSRLKQLATLVGKSVVAHGSDGNYRCTIRIDVADILPSSVYDFLSIMGVKPSVQNVWDMVPYSFVVDWFVGISDVMQWFDNWTYAMTIEPTEIWFSSLEQTDHVRAYMRVRGRKLNVPPTYGNISVSGKTWLFRLGDAISLFS
jgi:hypothetical protein